MMARLLQQRLRRLLMKPPVLLLPSLEHRQSMTMTTTPTPRTSPVTRPKSLAVPELLTPPQT